MKESYKEAFTEVSAIIKIMPKTMINKLPYSFIKFIDSQKSKNYVSNICEPLEKCSIKEETKFILYLMYRDYICDNKTKLKLQYRDKKILNDFKLSNF